MKFLREILTIMASLLALALTAALAVPYFVDWGQHRPAIEEQLSRALGLPVRVGATIELRLLPAPRLALDDVRIGGEADPFATRARQMRFELAAMALMRGEFRFTEAEIVNPEIKLSVLSDGGLALPKLPDGLPGQIALESLAIRNARVEILKAGAANPSVLEDLSLDISAPALTGPWRGSGEWKQAGFRAPFQFNTGLFEAGRARLKFAGDANGAIPRVEFDGVLAFAAGTDGNPRPGLEGQARIAGQIGASTPWEISGELAADASLVKLERLELKAGGTDRPFSATGALRYAPGEDAAHVSLEAPRADADFAGAGGAAAAALAPFIEGRLALPPLTLAFRTPALTAGGEAATDVSLTFARRNASSAAITASAALPGRGQLALDGVIETGAAAHYTGRLEIGARDIERLAQWLRALDPTLGERVAALPFASLEMKGRVEASAAGLFSRDAEISADRSKFRGLVGYTRAIGRERARFALDLISPALDLDQLPDLTPLAAAGAETDFSIALDARAVRLARVGQGMVDSGRIVARARREGETLELQQFDIANLGGASLAATGALQKDSARLDVKLDAERLSELAAVVQRVAPGIWSEALARRAVALSPAALTFRAQGARNTDGKLGVSRLNVAGTARGTRVDGAIIPDPANPENLTALLALANPQTPLLLRQAGIETIAIDRLPGGRIEIEAKGSTRAGFQTRASASLAGAGFGFSGTVFALLPRLEARGNLTLESADASPLMQVLAYALPDAAARAPIAMKGEFAASEGRVEIKSLSGRAFGGAIAGALAVASDGPQGAMGPVTGRLDLETIGIESIAALALGPRPPARGGAIWPDFRFAPLRADAPRADVAVTARRVLFPGGGESGEAKFQLQLSPGLVAMSAIESRIGGMQIGGRLALRRDGANAGLAGHLTFEGEGSAPRNFSYRGKGEAEFAGTGSSYAAIASGLAGRGKVEFARLEAANADPAALTRTIGAYADTLEIAAPAITARLARELSSQPSVWENTAYDLAIAGGVTTLTPLAPSRAPRASLDLRNFSFDAALPLSAPAPERWSGAPPEASIVWQGPVHSPQRTLNLASLINGLGARAIEIEAERIEMLEFDARERAAFNRRMRAEEFMRQREIEIAAWQVEQERRAEDERRRAAEAERLRLQEEQRAAARQAAAEAARKAEAERERKERATRAPAPPARAPLQLVPPPQAGPRVNAPPPPLSDPATAGRY